MRRQLSPQPHLEAHLPCDSAGSWESLEPGIGSAPPHPQEVPTQIQQGHDSQPHPTFLPSVAPGTTRLTRPSRLTLHRLQQEEASGNYQLPGESEPRRCPWGGGGQSLLPQLESPSPGGSGPHNSLGEPPRCSARTPAPQAALWTLGPAVPAAAAGPLGWGR